MTKTTIAIIGAAEESGAAIVKTLAGGAYSLLLQSSDEEALKRLTASLKQKTSVTIIDCAKDASWEADVVILAVPQEEEVKAAKYIKDVVTQKLVVSFAVKGIAHCRNELEKMLPYSKIVQAVWDENEQYLLSGSSEEAVREAVELLESAGIKPENIRLLQIKPQSTKYAED